MNKAMTLAAYLFDRYRTPAHLSVSRSPTSITIDEGQQFTPGMRERLARIFKDVTP